jgi:hypothetical protein
MMHWGVQLFLKNLICTLPEKYLFLQPVNLMALKFNG